MKAQVEEIRLENEGLKRKMGMGIDSDALELLSSMTSLCIHCVNSSGVLRKYSCNVVDGALKGHLFTLTWDQRTREYTYNPEQSPIKNLKQVAVEFSGIIFFPENMLSRFLINLLHVIHGCS